MEMIGIDANNKYYIVSEANLILKPKTNVII